MEDHEIHESYRLLIKPILDRLTEIERRLDKLSYVDAIEPTKVIAGMYEEQQRFMEWVRLMAPTFPGFSGGGKTSPRTVTIGHE